MGWEGAERQHPQEMSLLISTEEQLCQSEIVSPPVTGLQEWPEPDA